jgi:[acyl-carrier-protein] S-malonyltransferase
MFFNSHNAKRKAGRVENRWGGALGWKPGRRGESPSATAGAGPAAPAGDVARVAQDEEAGPVPVEAPVLLADRGDREPRSIAAGSVDLRAGIGTASFAFRGYDLTNLGRSPELLEHPAYGPVVARHLDEASAIAAACLGRPFDLAARVRARDESSLATFAEDIATIVAMELAQVALLDEFFGVRVAESKQSFGYSIGEMASLVAGGMFTMEQLLPVPLMCAGDCAALSEGTTLGVLFSRGPALPLPQVQALCTDVSAEGQGMVGASAYLSPNTVLVIGQGDTLDRLEKAIPAHLPGPAMLRRKTHVLPPLHTPLVWQRCIPNRAATALYKIPGKLAMPSPRVVSCVTGAASYEPLNARDLLVRWVDHPQRLWDVLDETLRSGVDLVIHAGPGPNLIPATFERLSNNITRELGHRHRYIQAIGQGVGYRMNRHAWLARLLPSRAALLRVPHVRHVILEDWLLEQNPA